MPTDYIELGAIAVIFIYFIDKVFVHLKNKKENGVGGKLDVIRMNDLTHILTAVNEQTKVNHEDHTRQTEILAAIKTILEERK